MRYSIKTEDDKYWIGYDGEFITELADERLIFDIKSDAEWYIENTNVFGTLDIHYEPEL